jgi:hypothetical protein
MSKIGFDMDGVLVPDYNAIPNLVEEEFYLQTLYAKPLINPVGEFDVVTARFDDPVVRKITEQWCKQLYTAPQNIFMRPRGEETPAEFKYRVSMEQGYVAYVESDITVVNEMIKLSIANRTPLNVIHFDTFVSNCFKIS